MKKTVPSAEYQVLSEERETQHSVLGTQHSVKGFTLIELIVVIIIVVVLAGSLLTRVLYYQEQAEKAAMEQVVGAVQSALVMRYGTLMARGAASENQVGNLTTDNPINWLQQKPKNYAGEYFDPAPGIVSPGHWMFDLKTRDLIYILDHSANFTPGRDGKKWIRFHVKLGYEPVSGGPGSGKEVSTTLFVSTEPFHWFD